METCRDFIEWLGPDASTAVLKLFDDPADLARISSVSRSCRKFVVINGFSKSLCLRISPDVPSFSRIAEVSSFSTTTEGASSGSAEWESMVREHRVYLYLSHCLSLPKCERNCIYEAINASSTDRDPGESIANTLESAEIVDGRPSYWSSGGQRDPGVPESLTYKLVANLCIVDEIKIKPFRAFFQPGHPIYSAKSVRFLMGYSRLALESTCTDQSSLDENYHWTYTSPEFPMAQESVLQSFRLPKPVVCLGILRIELLGRVQRQASDDLYYICVCHVQVIGRPLSPVLDFDVLETADSLALKYFPDARSCTVSESSAEVEGRESTLPGPIHFSNDDDDDGDSDDASCTMSESSAEVEGRESTRPGPIHFSNDDDDDGDGDDARSCTVSESSAEVEGRESTLLGPIHFSDDDDDGDGDDARSCTVFESSAEVEGRESMLMGPIHFSDDDDDDGDGDDARSCTVSESSAEVEGRESMLMGPIHFSDDDDDDCDGDDARTYTVSESSAEVEGRESTLLGPIHFYDDDDDDDGDSDGDV